MNRAVLLSFAFAFITSARAVAAPTPSSMPDVSLLGELIMQGPDVGHIAYADRCSNGSNSDEAGFMKFVAAMRADKQSRLARTLAEAEARFVRDKKLYEVELGDWFMTYHRRDGCSDMSISFSAPIQVREKISNSHELWTKYLVTIDDDVVAERRTLRLRSITPLALRNR
jgi:hypothetical protein